MYEAPKDDSLLLGAALLRKGAARREKGGYEGQRGDGLPARSKVAAPAGVLNAHAGSEMAAGKSWRRCQWKKFVMAIFGRN